jgi:hypothetical protein
MDVEYLSARVKVMDAQEARGAWERARRRYLQDAVFHQIVQSLLRAVEDLDYAPRDIYDVATLVATVLDGRMTGRHS